MTVDELNTVFSDPFNEAIQRLENLLSQSGRAFLLGAGCSKCANLPLTAELTDKALGSDTLGVVSKKVLTSIRDSFSGASPPGHIEDFLSELVDLIAIANRRSIRNADAQTISLGGDEYTESQLLDAADQIRQAIAKIIGDKVNLATHRRFVDAVHRALRPGKVSTAQSVDYLVLNYDTLIEDALALARVRFSDGMDGGVSSWWNPETFERNDLSARVFKLHGSIDWHELPGSTLPHRVSASVDISEIGERRILIWPASTKYRETQLDPYAQLSERARRVLNPQRGTQRVLVVCGYSFGDAHINIEVERGLKGSAGDLTVIAFTNEDSPSGKLKEWHEDQSISDQVLIFANKGFFHGQDIRISEQPLLWWKFEHITTILEGRR
ncbi:MAG: SIR2 family protein [Candidatus Thiodiazotropha sp. (ex Dulcina madagascariensis)]|nr:SIR2 family protein [Candidatus Thiodiazotropha sp. (ex Dulcina madagascariensis)]